MRCKSCGFENPEGFVFCGQCGQSLLPRKKDDWRSYCIYCHFKDKSRPDGTSYCDGCEGEPLKLEQSEAGGSTSFSDSPSVFWKKTRHRFFSPRIYWPLMFFFLALLLFATVFFSFRWLSFSQTPGEKEREYLEFADRCLDDYDVIVEKMGEIGNQVFRPEEAGFEQRKAQALKEYEALESEVERVYRDLKSRPAPERFRDLKKKLLDVYKIIYTRELPELKEFITVVDHSIVVSMMKGDLSRSPFEKAVLVEEDISKKMEEIVRLRYMKGVTE